MATRSLEDNLEDNEITLSTIMDIRNTFARESLESETILSQNEIIQEKRKKKNKNKNKAKKISKL